VPTHELHPSFKRVGVDVLLSSHRPSRHVMDTRGLGYPRLHPRQRARSSLSCLPLGYRLAGEELISTMTSYEIWRCRPLTYSHIYDASITPLQGFHVCGLAYLQPSTNQSLLVVLLLISIAVQVAYLKSQSRSTAADWSHHA
jgi:hypothetical protein